LVLTLRWREMDSNFRFRAGRNRYPIGSAEFSWRSSRGSNPKSAPGISSASALISALRGSYGVFVTPSPSATACADATRLPDPGRRDRGTGAGKISANAFGEPRTRRHEVHDDNEPSSRAILTVPPSPTGRAEMAERERPRAVPHAPRSAPRFRDAAERRL
jgi:hypothetical protein